MFRVQGLRYRVHDLGFRVQGWRFPRPAVPAYVPLGGQCRVADGGRTARPEPRSREEREGLGLRV